MRSLPLLLLKSAAFILPHFLRDLKSGLYELDYLTSSLKKRYAYYSIGECLGLQWWAQVDSIMNWCLQNYATFLSCRTVVLTWIGKVQRTSDPDETVRIPSFPLLNLIDHSSLSYFAFVVHDFWNLILLRGIVVVVDHCHLYSPPLWNRIGFYVS